MLPKSTGLVISLLLLLLHSDSFGLPARDVQVITDREYFEVVQTCFKEAQSSIKVMMFEASYYEKYPNSPTNILIRELIAAHKRGVSVKVILERRDERQQESVNNEKTGTMLSREGVDVVYDPVTVTTHTKLLIVDGTISVVGSTNWTYSALEKNHEVSVLIRSSEVARRLQDYFQTIWKTCVHQRQENGHGRR
jgi:cardiolipin synthase